MHTYLQTIHTHIHTKDVCAQDYIDVYIYTYIYVCIYTYVHTHKNPTHPHTRRRCVCKKMMSGDSGANSLHASQGNSQNSEIIPFQKFLHEIKLNMSTAEFLNDVNIQS